MYDTTSAVVTLSTSGLQFDTGTKVINTNGIFNLPIGGAAGDGDEAAGRFTAVAITDTTASTSSSTGALIVNGGVGISGAVYTVGVATFQRNDDSSQKIILSSDANGNYIDGISSVLNKKITYIRALYQGSGTPAGNNEIRLQVGESGDATDILTATATGITILGEIQTTTSGTSAATAIRFVNANGEVGSISTSGSATTYNTSCDRRLKTHIRDYTASGPILDAIQPRIFDWKTGQKDSIGVVAQELYPVAPYAVTKGDDDSDTIHQQWQVDYSKLVPVLVAEVKSLRARVAALEDAYPFSPHKS
jgi:hypothetical protein